MDENPYKAPAGGFASGGFASFKARNWNPFALGATIGCAIAAVTAIVCVVAISMAAYKQMEDERRSRENEKARKAAEMADEKNAARFGPGTPE